MYKVDSLLLEKFNERVQQPSPLVYISRNQTAITAQRFWERDLITSTVGTRSSIAIRRPEGSFEADMIFTAQVENGTAIIRYAEPWPNIEDMKWNILTTLPNVSELSIMFDGYMEQIEGVVECFTTGNLPIIFYVDSSNSLKGWNMNTDVIFDISDTAYNVASVRGLYSKSASLDDGIFVFYTNASGQLWEASILGDEVTALTQISLKPLGVTGWIDVWASLTFDYRVLLQLKGNDGKVYELISKSRPSAFSLLEYAYSKKVTLSGVFGAIPPTLIWCENINVSGDWGRRVKLVFDSKVWHVSPLIKDSFRLVETLYNTYLYPISVTYGDVENEMYINFDNMNQAVEPLFIEYLGGTTLGSEDVPMDAFYTQVAIKNLNNHGDYEFVYADLSLTGELAEAFNGKLYETEYLQTATMDLGGSFFTATFTQLKEDEYMTASNMSLTGQYCDVNGIPL